MARLTWHAGDTSNAQHTLCFLFPDGTAYVGQTTARERYEKAVRRRFKAYGEPEVFPLGVFAPQTDIVDATLTLWRYRLSRQGIVLRRYEDPAHTYLVDMSAITRDLRHCGDRAILPVEICDRAAAILEKPRPELLVFCAIFTSGTCALGMSLLRPDEVFSLSRWFPSPESERYPTTSLPHEIFFIERYQQLSSGSYPYLAAEHDLSTWRAAFRVIGGRPIDLDQQKCTDLHSSFIPPKAEFLESLSEPLFEAITYATENWQHIPAPQALDGDDMAGSFPLAEYAPGDDDLYTVLRAIERNTRETLRHLTRCQAARQPKPSRRPLAAHPLMRPFSIFLARRS
ncbi:MULTISPECIES: hypothetical protein [Asaia]|uniref:Uncharacterized protein n=1 Tax=Asaia spathodeae TaxID=657016 RepID=A0ABX2P9W8_9PROT|nr:hypothetical protein [Asaia spathodeae]